MRILSKYDLFIFDWDHTLTTSTLLVTLLDLFNRRRRGARSEELAKAGIQKDAARNIAIDEDVSKLYTYFDDLYSFFFRPELKDGAVQTLEFLRKHRKKVAIFSDSKTYRLMKEARTLDVLKYIDFALAAQSIGYYKPHPMGLLFIRDRFRVPAGRSIYIGDMTGDILAAKLAGMGSCAVADGIDSYEALKRASPDYLMTSIEAFVRELHE